MAESNVNSHMKNGKYLCECDNNESGTTKNANHWSGNTNKPGFLITNPFLFSTLVRNASAKKATKTVIGNRKTNAFGRWEGAPGGSGSPPTNRF